MTLIFSKLQSLTQNTKRADVWRRVGASRGAGVREERDSISKEQCPNNQLSLVKPFLVEMKEFSRQSEKYCYYQISRCFLGSRDRRLLTAAHLPPLPVSTHHGRKKSSTEWMLLLATSKPDSKQGTQAKFLLREGQLHAVFIRALSFLTWHWLDAGIIKKKKNPSQSRCPLLPPLFVWQLSALFITCSPRLSLPNRYLGASWWKQRGENAKPQC